MRLLAAAVVVIAATLPASAQSWPSVSTDLPRAGGGEADVAVVVGVGRYAFLPAVPGAADNASDWFQHLVKVRGVPTERVTLLRDSEASRERIERALKTAAQQARPGGTAWLIFIGHGAPSPGGDDGLLLGVDTQPDIDSLGARGLTQGGALALLEGGAQAHTVAVFDACFSGRTAEGDRALVEGLQATLPVRKTTTKKPVTILSSSESFAGPLPGEARPAFSYVLLGALRGWADDNGDGSVTVDEAVAWSQGTLRATLKATARLPTVRGQTRDVVLARRVGEGPPDIEAIVLRRCPSGSRWRERRCEAVACPPGTAFDGQSCAATAVAVTCPAGTSWNGTTCMAQGVACPAGTRWDGSQCAASGAVACPAGSTWDGVRCAAASSPPPVTTTPPRVVVNEVRVEINFPEQPQFDIGKATLKLASRKMLDEMAPTLAELDEYRFVVEGHTDNVPLKGGGTAGLQKLSQARAEAVRAHLISCGVPAGRIEAVGYGDTKPVASNTSAAGRARNRRIEIKAIPLR